MKLVRWIGLALMIGSGSALGAGFMDLEDSDQEAKGQQEFGEPESHDLRIIHSQVRGTACYNRDFRATTTRDGDHIVLEYFNTHVSADHGERENQYCIAELELDVPRGWRIGLEAVSVRGFASVSDQSSEASIRVSYAFDHGHDARITNRRQPGYFNQDFAFTDYMDARYIEWSDCASTRGHTELVIETDLGASASRDGHAVLSDDRYDRSFNQSFGVRWERCGNPPPPPSEWQGACLVVLETLWGDNLEDFWGYATARTERQAVDDARYYATRDCEDRRNGQSMLKCTVDSGNCRATPR